MDQCLIDVTGVDCRPGDEAVFFGYDRFGNCLPSQEVALLIGGDEGCGLTAALSPAWSELTASNGSSRGGRFCPPRVYLKTPNVTGSEEFSRCARHFFAGILTYFKEK